MPKLDNILVYHWQACEGFLISHLVADYCHLAANYNDDIYSIEPYLTPNIQAVLMQINLSNSALFPAKRQQLIQSLIERGIRVLNTEVNDITKRHIHRLLEYAGLRSARAKQQGAADQLLFIKSNLNWGGIAEQRLPDSLQQKLLKKKSASIQSWDAYYTIRRGDINPEFWRDNSIVIETYIENPDDSFYRVYGFGDAIVIVKAHSDALIKKINQHPKDENFTISKQQLFEQKTELACDLQQTIKTFIVHYPLNYFCLDIVHDTKNHYIIDLNLTPYAGIQPQTAEAINFLRWGGYHYLKTNLQQDLAQA